MAQSLACFHKQPLELIYQKVTKDSLENLEIQKNQKDFQKGSDIEAKPTTSQSSYMKKTSISTECSMKEDAEQRLSPLKSYKTGENLFFTFFPRSPSNEPQASQQTMKFKYRNQNLDRVLLYALVFTHFHVEAMTQEPLQIAHIFNIDKDNTKRLSAALQRLQAEAEAQDQPGQSLQPLLNFVQGLSFARQRRLSDDLKAVVNGISPDRLLEIFCELGRPHYSPAECESHQDQNRNPRMFFSEGTPVSKDEHSSVLGALATSLKIRVSVEGEGFAKNWGEKGSRIRYLIKHDSAKDDYYLGEIFFYKAKVEKKQAANVHFQSSQYTQI